MIGGVNYESIDERGLLISFGEKREKAMLLEVDYDRSVHRPGTAARTAGSRSRPPASPSI